MTTREMADKIVSLVRERGSGVSFVEITKSLGDAAEGDMEYGMIDRNIIWWSGVNEQFVDAMNLAMSDIEPYPCSVLVYLIDGRMLKMPLVKSNRSYKKSHWLPITFSVRTSPLPQTVIDGTHAAKAAANETAELVDGKCSICAKEGKKSKVYMDGFGSCTPVGCGPGYYDEDGKWVPPPPCNTCTYEGHCSRGHKVVQTVMQ
jgi:hypothetical protein